jgi:hypothetical protein
MPRRAPPSRARRAAPNMPRSPREDGVNKPSRGPRGPIAALLWVEALVDQ